jgi:hypothetical protein
LRLKPDVSAPGVSILSSVPGGHWEAMSGTSMATPQIAGAAAQLIERHPGWTVAELKAALIETGSSVRDGAQVATPIRAGGGLANPFKADVPLVFASPTSVSFGLVRPGASIRVHLDLADAGGGAGTWDVAVEPAGTATGAAVSVAPTVAVPGGLDLAATVDLPRRRWRSDGGRAAHARRRRPAASRSGCASLGRPSRPPRPRRSKAPGLRAGNTRGQALPRLALPLSGRPPGRERDRRAAGPEQVFSFTLTRPVANLGVVITRRQAPA